MAGRSRSTPLPRSRLGSWLARAIHITAREFGLNVARLLARSLGDVYLRTSKVEGAKAWGYLAPRPACGGFIIESGTFVAICRSTLYLTPFGRRQFCPPGGPMIPAL